MQWVNMQSLQCIIGGPIKIKHVNENAKLTIKAQVSNYNLHPTTHISTYLCNHNIQHPLLQSLTVFECLQSVDIKTLFIHYKV